MEKGVILYDDGKPICNICGLSFNKLITHVIQAHQMTGKEYKIRYGYDIHKSIMSKSSVELASKRAIENFPTIIYNLLDNGKNTRFKKGHKGRTRDKISAQTDIRLKNNIKKLNNKNGK